MWMPVERGEQKQRSAIEEEHGGDVGIVGRPYTEVRCSVAMTYHSQWAACAERAATKTGIQPTINAEMMYRVAGRNESRRRDMGSVHHQITSNRSVHRQELTAGMRPFWTYNRSQDRRRNGGD
jgi:hypothetical protein